MVPYTSLNYEDRSNAGQNVVGRVQIRHCSILSDSLHKGATTDSAASLFAKAGGSQVICPTASVIIMLCIVGKMALHGVHCKNGLVVLTTEYFVSEVYIKQPER